MAKVAAGRKSGLMSVQSGTTMTCSMSPTLLEGLTRPSNPRASASKHLGPLRFMICTFPCVPRAGPSQKNEQASKCASLP